MNLYTLAVKLHTTSTLLLLFLKSNQKSVCLCLNPSPVLICWKNLSQVEEGGTTWGQCEQLMLLVHGQI